MGAIRIIFVCTGNTCRSCMAEAIFRNAVENLEDKDGNQYRNKAEVTSAGIAAYCNAQASINAVKVMEEQGIDLKKHRSRQLTEDLVNDSELILTMTRAHKEYILEKFPGIKDKVFTLKEYGGTDELSLDITDPYGYGMETYRRCADEIRTYVLKAINRIFF